MWQCQRYTNRFNRRGIVQGREPDALGQCSLLILSLAESLQQKNVLNCSAAVAAVGIGQGGKGVL
jgi:hypothetical protein